MKLNGTKHEIGEEIHPIELIEGTGDKDIHPDHWEATGIHKVDKVRMTADSHGQTETVLSSHIVERKVLKSTMETAKGLQTIQTPVEKTIDVMEKEFEKEDIYVTLEDAIIMKNGRNVFMAYVVKIKGCDNFFYTKELSKVMNLLEHFCRHDDLDQKVIIQRTQRTFDEWINLDITPVDIVIQYASGEIKEITEEIRSRDIEKFVFEVDDDDVAEMDEGLSIFRDIETYTKEAAENSRNVMLDQNEKDEILSGLNIMTKSTEDDGKIIAGPQRPNPNRVITPSSTGKGPKSIKRVN